jgi:16S rRNA (cytidine1402-2'-O)-methyltransferase
MTEEGILYVVGTPIGNLEDITLRAIRTLKDVDVIICEDTKKSKILLEKYGINKPLFSYYKPKEKEKAEKIIEMLEKGKKLALITDAGTPLISDPGAILISELHKKGIKIVAVPGASSVTTALSISGFSADRFIFEGFLPKKKGEIEKRLKELKHLPHTLVFFIPGRDFEKHLTFMLNILGNRKVCIARELTKYYEEIKIGNIEDILSSENELKGEFTVVVEGAKTKDIEKGQKENIVEILKSKIKEGSSFKNLMRSKEFEGFKRNELYKIWQEVKNGKGKTKRDTS